MKQRNLLFVVVIGLLALLAYWYFFSRPSESARKVQQQKAKQATKAPQPTSASQGATTNALTKLKSKGEKMREGLSLLNHQPIEFYGKAIDQNDEPLADATVMGHVQINDGYRQTLEKYETTTDSNGMFEFRGFSGRDLGIAVSKPGYQRESEHTANSYFKYSLMFREKVHHPDPSNPVIFKMWKLAGAEGMVKGGGGGHLLPCDGTPIYFDLLTSKKVDGGGDLKITLDRHPTQGVSRQKGYDWKSKVEVVDGGLLEVNDVFPYLAPETGYQTFFETNMAAGVPDWKESLEKTFYVKLRNGKMYGRMSIRVRTFSDPPPTQVYFESWLNPTGSRNLEYDPDKRISPERIAAVGLEKAIEEASQSRKSSGLNDKLEMTNDK